MNIPSDSQQLTAADIAGLILAGGKSTRMEGQNKALLPFGDTTLLDHCYAIAARHLKTTLISCGPHHYSQYPTQSHVPDNGEQGPLGGVLAGLQWLQHNSHHQWMLTMPCDTPYIDESWIAFMIKGINPNHPTKPVYAQHNGRNHYAHALWPASAIAAIKKALEQQQYSLCGALQKLNAVALDLSKDCSSSHFFNINSLADAATAQQKLTCSKGKKQPK